MVCPVPRCMRLQFAAAEPRSLLPRPCCRCVALRCVARWERAAPPRLARPPARASRLPCVPFPTARLRAALTRSRPGAPGPGMLGLPAAFLSGGYLVASGFTAAFAALSALCCAFIAHACRVYRTEARGPSAVRLRWARAQHGLRRSADTSLCPVACSVCARRWRLGRMSTSWATTRTWSSVCPRAARSCEAPRSPVFLRNRDACACARAPAPLGRIPAHLLLQARPLFVYVWLTLRD